MANEHNINCCCNSCKSSSVVTFDEEKTTPNPHYKLGIFNEIYVHYKVFTTMMGVGFGLIDWEKENPIGEQDKKKELVMSYSEYQAIKAKEHKVDYDSYSLRDQRISARRAKKLAYEKELNNLLLERLQIMQQLDYIRKNWHLIQDVTARKSATMQLDRINPRVKVLEAKLIA